MQAQGKKEAPVPTCEGDCGSEPHGVLFTLAHGIGGPSVGGEICPCSIEVVNSPGVYQGFLGSQPV